MGRALDAYRRYRMIADRGELDRLSEVIDDDFVENCIGLTGWTVGLDVAVANLRAGVGQAFSDRHTAEREVVDGGDAVVIRGEITAVHTGPFLGIPATKRHARWEFLDMYRVGPDGRLNWHFLVTDWNLVRLQLLDEAPDLPTTPTRRAVQVEQQQHPH